MSTIAVRIPAIMTGSARGSSTLINRLHEFIPMALDASIKDGSTSLIPVYVFRTIGRSEYKNSAITAGKVPIPTRGISNPNKASEGMVCSTAVTPMIGSAMRSCLVKYSQAALKLIRRSQEPVLKFECVQEELETGHLLVDLIMRLVHSLQRSSFFRFIRKKR